MLPSSRKGLVKLHPARIFLFWYPNFKIYTHVRLSGTFPSYDDTRRIYFNIFKIHTLRVTQKPRNREKYFLQYGILYAWGETKISSIFSFKIF